MVLEGSRGLSGNSHAGSDIDLSLVVDRAFLPASDPDRAELLRSLLRTTLDSWRGEVELDIAAVFGDDLRLFALRDYDADVCRVESFGVYKIQKGFNGYVPAHILDLRKMYPMLTIWHQ